MPFYDFNAGWFLKVLENHGSCRENSLLNPPSWPECCAIAAGKAVESKTVH
jgi:hypothetical protein